jgi:hypothetical protein
VSRILGRLVLLQAVTLETSIVAGKLEGFVAAAAASTFRRKVPVMGLVVLSVQMSVALVVA